MNQKTQPKVDIKLLQEISNVFNSEHICMCIMHVFTLFLRKKCREFFMLMDCT